MNLKNQAALILSLLLLGGCIPSLHPLFAEDETVFDQSLLGTWVEGDGGTSYEFIKNDNSSYTLTYTEDSIVSDFSAHLTKIGDHLFLDILPERPECGNELYKGYLIAAHSFYKVSLDKAVLRLDGLDVDWLKNLNRDGKTNISHEIIQDDNFVLTASTKELRKFVLKYAKDESAFPKGEQLFRQE